MNRYDPDLLLGYIEDELGEAERAQFEQQMAEDDQLAALVNGLAGDRALMRSLPIVDAPAGLVDDAMHRLERSMLLDGPRESDAAPIPIQRGREIAGRAGDTNWGRVLGLTGLAAAVLIGAGITWQIIYDDRLSKTARDLVNESEPEAAQPETAASQGPEAESFADLGENRSDPDGGTLAQQEPRRMNTEDLESATAPDVADADSPGPAHDKEPGNGLLQRVQDAILANGGNEPLPTEPALPPVAAGQPFAPARASSDAPVIALADNVALYDNPAPQLFVVTDSPFQTQLQIVEWCLANGVPVVETQGLDFAYSYDSSAWPLFAAQESDENQPRLALLIEQEQLGVLVKDMNRFSDGVENFARQRAALNTAPTSRQRAQIQARPGPEAPLDLEDEAPRAQRKNADEQSGYAQLRAPKDLGNEENTRQNYDNLLVFNNQIALEQETEELRPTDEVALLEGPATPGSTQPKEGEQPQPLGQPEPPAVALQGQPADDQTPEAEPARDDAAPALDPAQERIDQPEQTPGLRAAPRSDRDAAVDQEADRERAGDLDDDDFEQPVLAPRGNWLSPQLPLAINTPIWSNSPRTQIVPIVLRQVEPAEMERMLREEAQSQIGTNPDEAGAAPAEGAEDAADPPAEAAPDAPGDAPASE